jgi:hypothetical protein
VGEVLGPTLPKGHIPVIDNLSAHTNAATLVLVEAAVAEAMLKQPSPRPLKK